jgi:enoyl-CoA hydratase
VEGVSSEIRDQVAVVRLDDGKANALSPGRIAALGQAVDEAEAQAGALLLIGREGRFSAGFDLKALGEGPEVGRSLVQAGGELAMRLYALPMPVVIACTGHAIAMGAVLLLSADLRLGARGDFKIGLNEVSIGMSLPVFALELARGRLSKRHFDRAVLQGELYAPDAAADVGYLDTCCESADLEGAAFEESVRLAALPRGAYARTKARMRSAVVGSVLDGMQKDLSELM